MTVCTETPPTPSEPGVAAGPPPTGEDDSPAFPHPGPAAQLPSKSRRMEEPRQTPPAGRPLSPLAERYKAYMAELRATGVKPDPPIPPPVYICSVCKDAGFVYPRDEWGRVIYSRAVPCSGRGCKRDQMEQLRFADSPAVARGVQRPEQTFESFQPVRGAAEALRHARSLAAGRGDFIWLLIYGDSGNGKTHLCNAMAREVIRRGIDTRLVAVADLFTAMRSAIGHEGSDSTMQRFKETQFLVLDDYGTQAGSEWETARFDELMAYRYAGLMPTAMTTNLDVTELPERLRSRFEDRMLSRIAHNSAPDFRARRPAAKRRR